jgi:hypothetical protein
MAAAVAQLNRHFPEAATFWLLGGAGMPKRPKAGGYEVNVDRVIEPGQVTRDGKIAILVTAGSARLRLHFEPADALGLADGILAALRQMGQMPTLR